MFRKFAFLIVAVLVVGALVVPSITSGQQELPVPREETIFLEDTQLYTVFDSFNNRIPNGVQGAAGFNQVAQEGLWQINVASGEIESWLGKTWEYNEDYTELTLYLVEEAYWNDGEPFTADDVVYTLLTVRDVTELSGGEGLREFVEDVEAVDEYTVKITLTKPAPRFHYTFTGLTGQFWIWPEHVWSKEDPTTFKNNPPVTTAVWKFKEAIPDLRLFIWERDDNYWNKDEKFPEAKYLIYRNSPESPDVNYAELVNNTIDHAHRIQYPQMEQAQQENPNILLAPYDDPCPRGMWFNTAKYPLSLKEVRWALSYLQNRPKIAEFIWSPESIPAEWPWSTWPFMQQYVFDDVIEKYKLEYDPAKAEEILDELGFTKGDDGIRVDGEGNKMSYTIITPSAVGFAEYQIAQDLAEEAAKVGIELTVKHMVGSTMWDALDNGEFDITSHWHCGAWIDALQLYEGYTCDRTMPGEHASPVNFISFCNPELDEQVEILKTNSPTSEEAQAAYKKALEIWMEELPAMPSVQTIYVMNWNTTYWEGWPVEDNYYVQPFTWWSSFINVPFALTSTAEE